MTAPTAAGGLGHPPAVGRQVAEVLAGACGATWFVWAQHGTPLSTLAGSGNGALQERHLPGLAAGTTLSGVAFTYLRRRGPPPVVAARTNGGWRFDGAVDWVTGWGLADLFLLGGMSAGGEVVLALLSARAAPGLTASAPLRLAAMQGTRTVRLALDRPQVADRAVVDVVPVGEWHAADAAHTAGGRQTPRRRPPVETNSPRPSEPLPHDPPSRAGTRS